MLFRSRFPIVAMGSEFWGHMRDFARDALIAERTISQRDLDLLKVTDLVEEAIGHIRRGIPTALARQMRERARR